MAVDAQRLTQRVLLDGCEAAATLAKLPDLRDLAEARAVCKFWCDASHWFVIAAAAVCVESNEAQLPRDAALGLLRHIDRRPPLGAARLCWSPVGDHGNSLWRPLRRAWQVPVPWPGGPFPVWPLEHVKGSTPRRLDGIDAAAERAERCAACKLAHALARRLFRKGALRDRVRALACLLVQVAFMYVSVPPESAHVAAAAAVSLAAYAADALGPGQAAQLRDGLAQMEDERRAGQSRAALGSVLPRPTRAQPRGQEERLALHERVFELKLVILRAVRFDLQVELPHEHVEGLVTRLLAYLPGGAATLARDFRARLHELGGEDGEEEDDPAGVMGAAAVKQLLSGLARRFVDDMLLSLGPLLAPPRAVAAAAALAAMQAISTSSRTFYSEGLFRSLEAADRWLELGDVRKALEEWGELRRSQGKPVVFS